MKTGHHQTDEEIGNKIRDLSYRHRCKTKIIIVWYACDKGIRKYRIDAG